MKSLIRIMTEYDRAWVDVAHNPALSIREHREAWHRFVRIRAELNERTGHPEHANTFHEDQPF